ncbi:MAG: hypothetical protein A2096_06920 [Spirochaetes bacterium GWF1_41_5]|nr:MAG: hypothetical protein A2096_06920 [Spirochaetes bacterium GWF1_41_5]HBE04418.1 hypothetical protein [Spirochaetia bacterium]
MHYLIRIFFCFLITGAWLFSQTNKTQNKSLPELRREISELEKQNLELEQEILRRKLAAEEARKWNPLDPDSAPDVIKTAMSRHSGGLSLFTGYVSLNSRVIYPGLPGHFLFLGSEFYGYVHHRFLLGGKIGRIAQSLQIAGKSVFTLTSGGIMTGGRFNIGRADFTPYGMLGTGRYAFREYLSLNEMEESGAVKNEKTVFSKRFFALEAGLKVNIIINDEFSFGLLPNYLFCLGTDARAWGVMLIFSVGRFAYSGQQVSKGR